MYEDMMKNIIEIYDYIKDKSIIIFGCGLGGKYIYSILKNLDLNPSMFYDNNFKEKYCLGKQVRKPMEIDINDNQVILIANNNYTEIVMQLNKLGYVEGKTIFNALKQSENSTFKVGKYTYGWKQFLEQDCSVEYIGSFTSIGPNCTIASFNHPLNMVSTHPAFYLKNRGFIEEDDYNITNNIRKNYIGNDVWIGADVTILPGIRINNGAVIGAGSVVTKDVPSYAIVVGVPAKVTRYRVDEHERKRLNEIAWWNWDDDKIKKNMQLFRDVQLFINSF